MSPAPAQPDTERDDHLVDGDPVTATPHRPLTPLAAAQALTT
ncbi:hypothetical protein [Streptomyces sp. NBC_01190]|nr:hypothetical protein OG519_28355 [Streptomyces sp. NBC_01190]